MFIFWGAISSPPTILGIPLSAEVVSLAKLHDVFLHGVVRLEKIVLASLQRKASRAIQLDIPHTDADDVDDAEDDAEDKGDDDADDVDDDDEDEDEDDDDNCFSTMSIVS